MSTSLSTYSPRIQGIHEELTQIFAKHGLEYVPYEEFIALPVPSGLSPRSFPQENSKEYSVIPPSEPPSSTGSESK